MSNFVCKPMKNISKLKKMAAVKLLKLLNLF